MRKLIIILTLAFIVFQCKDPYQRIEDIKEAHKEEERLKVLTIAPRDGDTGIPVNQKLSITFSKEVKISTFDEALTLSTNGIKIIGAIEVSDSTITFIPENPMLFNSAYTVSLEGSITAIDNWDMEQEHKSSFSTEGPPLSVLSSYPRRLATDINENTYISITLSEAVDPNSLTNQVEIQADNISVNGVITIADNNPNQIIFTPGDQFPFSALCSVVVKTLISNQQGNKKLVQEFFSVFKINNGPDTTAPSIIGTVPGTVSSDIPVPTFVAIIFDEGMDPVTTSAAITVKDSSGIDVLGDVWIEGEQLIFEPTSPLNFSETYTVTVLPTAEDFGGNLLTSGTTFSFTTRSNVDTEPPTVTSTFPDNLQSNIASDIAISIQFSEIMTLLATQGAVQVYDGDLSGGVIVNGTTFWNGNTLNFTPINSLTLGSIYTVVVGIGATDVTGNALVNPYQFSFTTVDPSIGEPYFTVVPDSFNQMMDRPFKVIVTAYTGASIDTSYLGNVTLTSDWGDIALSTDIRDSNTLGVVPLPDPVINNPIDWNNGVAKVEVTINRTTNNVDKVNILASDGNAEGESQDFSVELPEFGNMRVAIDIGASGLGFDDVSCISADVIKDNNLFKIWYAGTSDNTIYQTIYAESNNSFVWNNFQLAISNNSSGTGFDTQRSSVRSVVKDGDLYKLWYDGTSGVNGRILYAESDNGINWINYVLAVNNNSSGLGYDTFSSVNPSVIKVGNLFIMIYDGFNAVNDRLIYTSSSDGKVWENYDFDKLIF